MNDTCCWIRCASCVAPDIRQLGALIHQGFSSALTRARQQALGLGIKATQHRTTGRPLPGGSHSILKALQWRSKQP